MKRICIIPGWMPTMTDYKKLANDLNANIYRPKGDSFISASKDLNSYLFRAHYDVVIGFDSGASMILNTHCAGKVILVNPFYKEVNGFATYMNPSLLSTMTVARFGVKLVGLFMVNSPKCMTKEFIDNFMNCSHAKDGLFIQGAMAFKRADVSVSKKILVRSAKDRIIPKSSGDELIKDCNIETVVELPGGHTPILECYDKLLEELRKLVVW